MFQRKQRKFRRRPNGRNNQRHGMRPIQFSNNGQSRNNFRSSLSAEKSLEKYTSLAKEAMSAGDKTLSENYLQHADHFMRIIEDKNKNKNQANDGIVNKATDQNKSLSYDNNINQSKEIKK